MYTYTIREKEASRPDPIIYTNVFTNIDEFLPCLISAYTQYTETVKAYLPRVKKSEPNASFDSEDDEVTGYGDADTLAMDGVLKEEYEKLNPSRLTREWLEGLPVGESIVHVADSKIFQKMYIDGQQMYFIVVIGYQGAKRGWIIRTGNTTNYKLRDRMGHGTITTNPYKMVKKVNIAIETSRIDAVKKNIEYTYTFKEPFTLADLERLAHPVYLYYAKDCNEDAWIEVYDID